MITATPDVVDLRRDGSSYLSIARDDAQLSLDVLRDSRWALGTVPVVARVILTESQLVCLLEAMGVAS